MNDFDKKLKEHCLYPLKAKDMSAIIVIMGHKCNLVCTHCYLEASPARTEVMPLSTLEKILDLLEKHPQISVVNITGGSAELSPHFRYFVKAVSDMGRQAMVSSNLTVYFEPGLEDLPEFLAQNRVVINASLPHYAEEEMDRVRGKGTHKKAIAALRKLNTLGYGKSDSGLMLNFLYTPYDAKMAPDMKTLEDLFREKLQTLYGITFNSVFTINNMPMGRFEKKLSREQVDGYLKELEHNFNPSTVENMMCKTSVSFALDGSMAYDCDFWRVLNMPVKLSRSDIDSFDYKTFSNREIVTHPLCFVCTAGAGVGCSDLLV